MKVDASSLSDMKNAFLPEIVGQIHSPFKNAEFQSTFAPSPSTVTPMAKKFNYH